MFTSGIQRRLTSIPKKIIFLFILGLSLQLTLQYSQSVSTPKVEKLQSPPVSGVLSMMSFGSPEVLAKFLILWLQAFDNQPGVSIPFKKMDYPIVINWLDRIISLDTRANYPVLVASRIYTEVPDKQKQRLMMEFVYQQFLLNPRKNWVWLAHVTVLAKHRLEDHELALKFAHILADKKFSDVVPNWARQLEIIVLEEMGELEAVRILVGGMIKSHAITDTKELYWLEQRLKNLDSNVAKTESRF